MLRSGFSSVEETGYPVSSDRRAKEWRVMDDILRTNMDKLTI